jgi:hypothetical protein
MANDFICTLDFEDIDLSRPGGWRPRMIDLLRDPTFDTLMSDLVTTSGAMDSASVAREVGGSCEVHADVHSGGGSSAGVSCGIRF